jgi:uncharacterized protein YaeQ
MIYRFRIDLADVDRSVYEQLDVRLALHPSETIPYLLTRLLAYALNYEPGLAFSSGGLSDPDAPALASEHPQGGRDLWIEIGNPSSERLHKAAKAARRAKVYTYKNTEALLRELAGKKIHAVDRIALHSFGAEFLGELEAILERGNDWSVLHDQGTLLITAWERMINGEVLTHRLSDSDRNKEL